MANTIEHVGIVVDNLAKAKAFLGNVMGFQLDENRIFPTEGLRRPSSALGQSKLRRSSVRIPNCEASVSAQTGLKHGSSTSRSS